MTSIYYQRRTVREMQATHMTVRELAALCHVGGNTISKACKLGKVRAVSVGRMWMIPRLDGQLFADAYIRQNAGEQLTPKVKPLSKRVWDTDPQTDQSIRVELPPRLIRAIDHRRALVFSESGRRQSRTSVIREALQRMLEDQPIMDPMSRLEAMG